MQSLDFQKSGPPRTKLENFGPPRTKLENLGPPRTKIKKFGPPRTKIENLGPPGTNLDFLSDTEQLRKPNFRKTKLHEGYIQQPTRIISHAIRMATYIKITRQV